MNPKKYNKKLISHFHKKCILRLIYSYKKDDVCILFIYYKFILFLVDVQQNLSQRGIYTSVTRH